MNCTPKIVKLKDVFAMLNQKKIKLNPPYQRNEVWSKRMTARLFRSMLEGVVVPAFYFRVIRNGRYECIDGKQRLIGIEDVKSGKVVAIDHKFAYNNKMPADVKRRLDNLPVMIVEVTGNDREIETLFQDLNSGKSLTVNEKNHADPTKPAYLICKLLDDAEIIETFHCISKTRFSHWSWISQCASLVWQDMTDTKFQSMGNKYKFEGMEKVSDKKEVANRLDEDFTTMQDYLGNYHEDFSSDGDIQITSAIATEIFWMYDRAIALKYNLKEIDHKALIVDYLNTRSKKVNEQSEEGRIFFNATNKGLLLKESTTIRMAFVENYVKTSRAFKKPFAISL